MKKSPLSILLAALFLLTLPVAKAQQTFATGFENEAIPYWNSLRLVADTLLMEHPRPDSLPPEGMGDAIPVFDTLVNHYCECEPDLEYGPGFRYPIPDSLFGRNLHLVFQIDFAFPDKPAHATADLVCTIKGATHDLFWTSYKMRQEAHDSIDWDRLRFELDLPANLLLGHSIDLYLWNHDRQRIWIDNASVTLTPWSLPSFLPNPALMEGKTSSDPFLLTVPDDPRPLTYPIGMWTEYILGGDTLSDYRLFNKTEHNQWKMENDLLTTLLTAQDNPGTTCHLQLSTLFHKEGRLLRQALVIPFVDSTVTVYRRNLETERDQGKEKNHGLLQDEYYLDREGFKIGEGERSVVSYHPTHLSSTQFDANRRIAFFNLDYWRDHPMIQYPLSDTLEDYFEDRSCLPVHRGMEREHQLVLFVGSDVQHLPRIMPIPYGYESGIIFTEHADWTDLRTHRAVLFGSEKITKARKATGGFVHYGIPLTKSVFYNNPDQVTNDAVSRGTFHGLHATLKTDREFEKLLKQLYKIGFDICLHTPEQYTTTPDNLEEALDHMQRQFRSTTWIDHGYNNGPQHNRENLVCDGLNRQSDAYAADAWRRHGIRYLWNAYYEENRMEQWNFFNSLMKPYPGFGDALPNRQITLLETLDTDRDGENAPFLTWCTPATLEAVTDNDWDYYLSPAQLQQLVDNHDIHITHVYPAWVMPGRTSWTYDADSTIVALPGMNRALARIAALREEHRMLPMTVKTYLDHYSGLLQVDYDLLDATHIRLHNRGDQDLEGFTLLCSTPIRFEDRRYYEFRKSGNDYYIWFDLKPYDTVTIEITSPTNPPTP